MLAIVLGVLCLSLIFRLQKKADHAFKGLRKEWRNYQENRQYPASSSTAGNGREIKMLETKIAEQNDSIHKLQRELDALTMKTVETVREPVSYEQHFGTVPSSVFYMSAPSYNYFPLTARVPKSEALYKFTLISSDSEAKFEVLNDGLPLETFANYSSSYIDSACHAQNRPPALVKYIRTLTPGRALLDGDKWRIDTKAEIVYE
jgi:hypothetical protein